MIKLQELNCMYCGGKLHMTSQGSIYFVYLKCGDCKLRQMIWKDDVLRMNTLDKFICTPPIIPPNN